MEQVLNKEKEKVKLTVIIPVYNAEHYLRQCLDSVTGQSLKALEILCVDDGSTDSSSGILDEYAEKDKRIRVIHKENGGLVAARKTGVLAAAGKYTGYVDSDDWIEPEMFETLYDIAEQNCADMVSSGYFFEGNYVTMHYDGVSEGLYDESTITCLRENAIYNLELEDVGLRGSLCCKLFRTDLLKEVQREVSNKLSFSEDKMCVLSYILRCSRVYVLKQAFYHYISHGNSMVHMADASYLTSINEVYQHFIKLYSHPGFTPSMRLQAELYITELLYKGINSRLGFVNRNLFWLDPYYLAQIPEGARIALYGGGELGEAYRQQLLGRMDVELAGCVDAAYESMQKKDLKIYAPHKLIQWKYDFVLIAIKNQAKADEVRVKLERMGIPHEKILWFEQKEIFWKYAKANGWIAVRTYEQGNYK